MNNDVLYTKQNLRVPTLTTNNMRLIREHMTEISGVLLIKATDGHPADIRSVDIKDGQNRRMAMTFSTAHVLRPGCLRYAFWQESRYFTLISWQKISLPDSLLLLAFGASPLHLKRCPALS